VDFTIFVEGVYSTHDLTDLRSMTGRPLSDAWFTENGYKDVRLDLNSKGKLVFRFESDDWDEVSLLSADGQLSPGSHSKGGRTGRVHEVVWQTGKRALEGATLRIKRFVGVQALPHE
jgi:hypothetical protein